MFNKIFRLSLLLLCLAIHPAEAAEPITGTIDPVDRYAPIFITDRNCAYNIPTQVSFDGNWDPLDNESNYEALLGQYNPFFTNYPGLFRMRGISYIYYEAVASVSHTFVTYYLFYPHDAGDDCKYRSYADPGGHQNDASSMMLMLNNDPAGDFIDRIIMMDHGFVTVKKLSEIETVDGKPVIIVKTGTHQMTALEKNREVPESNLYYRFGLDTSYSLEPIFTSLWPQRSNEKLFCLFSDGIGVQYCEEKNKARGRGTPPWAPWAREFKPTKLAQEDLLKARGLAQSFFDPIKAFESLYSNGQFYSTEYLYNPYIDRK